ncbi:hypothetical protein H5410_027453, partial [Solanum commersonii]
SSINALDNTTISFAKLDYYDEPLGKYVPQNKRDEAPLLLISHLKTLWKEFQGCSNWSNEKAMKATRRLGKDNDELKMLRQEREDDEKIHREMQMPEENAIERIMEMEQAFVNTNSMIGTTNYGDGGLNALYWCVCYEREQCFNKGAGSSKQVSSSGVEKCSFEEDLSTIKQEKVVLLQQQEKANKVVYQLKEEKEKQRFLQQANSLKAEREQLHVKGKMEKDSFIE